MNPADAADTTNGRRPRKEYAVQRRLNIREEYVRDGPVYGAGIQ